jgi:hypothetical protein
MKFTHLVASWEDVLRQFELQEMWTDILYHRMQYTDDELAICQFTHEREQFPKIKESLISA